MAERRMFSKRVIDSARFLKMPQSTQNLYFHLGLHADDDGVVEAYGIMRKIGATEDDLKVLVMKKFVIVLNDDLVSYLVDWRENNKIRADRKIDSIYKDLLLQVVPDANLLKGKQRADRPNLLSDDSSSTDENKEKCLSTLCVEFPDNSGTSHDSPMSDNGQHRLGKVRLGQDNNLILSRSSCQSNIQQFQHFSTVSSPEESDICSGVNGIRIPSLDEVRTYAANINSRVNVDKFYSYYSQTGWKTKDGKSVEDWKGMLRCWGYYEGAYGTKAEEEPPESTSIYRSFIYNLE